MARNRSDEAEQIASLLQTARDSLGLSLAFLSRLDGENQTLEVVESSVPIVFREGASRPQATSLCQAIMDGRLPAVMPDLADFPEAMRLPAGKLRIRSFVSVPVVLSDGTVYGTFCAAGFRADRGLAKRDQALMEVLARAASVILEPRFRDTEHRDAIERRLNPVLAAGGPSIVLQPIVRLDTGGRVGAEALSRFPAHVLRRPDEWFADAHDVGLGDRLELLAIDRAADHLGAVTGHVALNVSPGTLLTEACVALLNRLPLHRVVLELSEHQQVEDYAAIRAVLDPLRARGLRLAIDDVGAGFSSMRHIVLTAPDLIKLDRSLIDGVGRDGVLHTLVRSLVDFAHDSGSAVVAEGIEQPVDAAVLAALGVDYGQGYFYGRPGPPGALATAAEDRCRPADRRAETITTG